MNEGNFWSRLFSRGWKYYTLSLDFGVAVSFSLLVLFAIQKDPKPIWAYKILSDQFLNVCLGLLAVVTTAYTVIITLSDTEFIEYLKYKGIAKDLMFVFEHAVMVCAAEVLLLLVGQAFIAIPTGQDVRHGPGTLYILGLMNGFSAYALFVALSALNEVSNYAQRRLKFTPKLTEFLRNEEES
jgi:hypothetical protein